MESIFGKFCENRNIAIEIAKYLDATTLISLVRISKRFKDIYS